MYCIVWWVDDVRTRYFAGIDHNGVIDWREAIDEAIIYKTALGADDMWWRIRKRMRKDVFVDVDVFEVEQVVTI